MSVGVFFHQSVGFGSIPQRKPNECFFILGVTLSWVLQHYYFPPLKKKRKRKMPDAFIKRELRELCYFERTCLEDCAGGGF